MLFNSTEFLFYFLPIVAAGYFLIGRLGLPRPQILWLIAASLFFYAFWNPPFILLLAGSIAANYLIGMRLMQGPSKPLLGAGIALNLAAIGVFKYAGFFAGTVNLIPEVQMPIPSVVLPLAISFFTFQQIAYLVDVYQGKVRDTDFFYYVLFVSFFPQLIAGPIVHHGEVIPQFAKRRRREDIVPDILAGCSIFIIGLQKKVVLADGIGIYANAVFDTAAAAPPTFFAAWIGTLAYTLQLYFDFSGYTDMAIGLARIFGIRLPENFDSPYKSHSIIDFWRRWHMTLSRFLRDYLYIPLGGSRKGAERRYLNIMITMALGGLWHGAGWTFVFWGATHGAYLLINHAWRRLAKNLGFDSDRPSLPGRVLGTIITFLAVAVAWVFFRADSWQAAVAVLQGLAGLNGVFISHSLAAMILNGTGIAVAPGLVSASEPLVQPGNLLWIAALLAIVFFLPNTRQWLERAAPSEIRPLGFNPAWSVPFVLVTGMFGMLIVVAKGGDINDFIYMVF